MHEGKTIGELLVVSCKELDEVDAKAGESTPEIWSAFKRSVKVLKLTFK